MRIKLNCLSCGHPLELDEAYEDYQGEVRCWGCRAVLEVTLQEGKLRSMKLGTGAANLLVAK
jgi:DNA-directed RNA polymerase subunit N (RpoN/RPB10)